MSSLQEPMWSTRRIFPIIKNPRLRWMAVAAATAAVVVAAVLWPAGAEASTSVAPGAEKIRSISKSSVRDVRVTASASLQSLPKSGGGIYTTVRVRSGSAGAYLGQARVHPGGVTTLSIKRMNGTGQRQILTTLGSVASTSKLRAGQQFTLTLSATGADRITLAATLKIQGVTGTTTVRATDTSRTRLRGAGQTDALFYTSSSTPATSASFISTAVSRLSAARPAAPKPVVTSPAAPESATPKPVAPEPAPKAEQPKPVSTPAPEPAPTPVKPTTPQPAKTAVSSGSNAASAAQAERLSAANTGVPAGTVLKVHKGDLIIRNPNTVISGVEVRGIIEVLAPGVVIKNSRIIGTSTPRSIGLVSNVNSGASFTIMDSEIYASTPDPQWYGILGSNFTAERLNIHDVVDPIHVVGNNVTVRSSWLHDSSYWVKDRMRGGTPTHDDSVQIEGGENIVLEYNRMEDAHNAAVQVTQKSGLPKLGSLTIRGNFLQGGGCTVNIGSSASRLTPQIRDNAFGPQRIHAGCAVVAPNAPVLSGNTWSVDGTPMARFTVG